MLHRFAEHFTRKATSVSQSLIPAGNIPLSFCQQFSRSITHVHKPGDAALKRVTLIPGMGIGPLLTRNQSAFRQQPINSSSPVF